MYYDLLDSIDIRYPDDWSGCSIGGKYGVATTGLKLYVSPECHKFTVVPINSRDDASRAVLIQVPLTYDFLCRLEAAVSELREALDEHNKKRKKGEEK